MILVSKHILQLTLRWRSLKLSKQFGNTEQATVTIIWKVTILETNKSESKSMWDLTENNHFILYCSKLFLKKIACTNMYPSKKRKHLKICTVRISFQQIENWLTKKAISVKFCQQTLDALWKHKLICLTWWAQSNMICWCCVLLRLIAAGSGR